MSVALIVVAAIVLVLIAVLFATVKVAREYERGVIFRLGRLLPGCKADFSLVDLAHPYMQPPLEPVRSLIFSASERAIRDVYVDGQQVVRDGKVLTIDIEAAVEAMNDGQRRRLATVPERDWARRTAEELAPRVFSTRERLPQSRPMQ